MIPPTTAADQRFFELFPQRHAHCVKYKRIYDTASTALMVTGYIFVGLSVPNLLFSTVLPISAVISGTVLTVSMVALPCIFLTIFALGALGIGIGIFLRSRFKEARTLYHVRGEEVIERLQFLKRGCNLFEIANDLYPPYYPSLKYLENMGLISKETRNILKPFHHLVKKRNRYDDIPQEKVQQLRPRWEEIRDQVLADLPSEAIIVEAFREAEF